MTVIQMPKTSIKFEIGDKTYTLSLADKTLGQIRKQNRTVFMNEVKAVQEQKVKNANYDQRLDNLQAEAVAKGWTDAEYKHEAFKLSNKYEHEANVASEKSESNITRSYIQYLNNAFGKGCGQEIYETCNKSNVVLGKVISQISINLAHETNLEDYRDKYVSKIEALKDDNKQSKSSEPK